MSQTHKGSLWWGVEPEEPNTLKDAKPGPIMNNAGVRAAKAELEFARAQEQIALLATRYGGEVAAHDETSKRADEWMVRSYQEKERRKAAERELEQLKPLAGLLNLLAYEGGTVVCSSALSPAEIAIAQAQGRVAVRGDGIGFVWQKKKAP